jgi:hypothetical protein
MADETLGEREVGFNESIAAAMPAHRRRGYRSCIVTESNKPAKGEFVDVSPDTGFFETLG